MSEAEKQKRQLRPIDKVRNSAGSITIDGDAGDAVLGMVGIKGSMIAIMAKSIHEIRRADQIDPQRTNINVPNTQQRILDLGADSEIVGRTFLTAAELMKGRYLTLSESDCEKCISFAFDAMKDLAAISRLSASFENDEQAALDKIGNGLQVKSRAVALPSVGGIAAGLKEFLQKADHVLQSLFAIVKVFYPDQKNMFEGLVDRYLAKYGKGDPLYIFLDSNLRFLRTIRRARNAVEHPNESQKVVCSDFSLQPDAKIAPPLVSLVDKEFPFPDMTIRDFYRQALDQIQLVFESVLAGLCDKHEREMKNMQFGVFMFEPGSQGLFKHVRYAHGIIINGQPTRAQ